MAFGVEFWIKVYWASEYFLSMFILFEMYFVCWILMVKEKYYILGENHWNIYYLNLLLFDYKYSTDKYPIKY